MNIIGRNYMRITSKNERVYLNSVNKVTFINNKRERERERGGGEEEVNIQAGEAIIIQNVCRY